MQSVKSDLISVKLDSMQSHFILKTLSQLQSLHLMQQSHEDIIITKSMSISESFSVQLGNKMRTKMARFENKKADCKASMKCRVERAK